MIAVKLMGGLGNQMFQYALARKLSIKNHTKPALDLGFLENTKDIDTPRHYELDCFNIVENFLPENKRPAENPDSSYAGKRGKLRYVKHRVKGSAWNIYREPFHNYDSNALKQKNRTYLVGFWQTDKYFSDIRDRLLEDFSFKSKPSKKNQALLEDINISDSVSLHVRRGDYVSNSHANKFHGTKGNDYYSKALKELENRIGKSYKIFVFSDDIRWCKDNLRLPKNTVFVDGNKKGCEDLRLMISCKHNIIANSTFSWWAAWLNRNPSKVVIAPKKWFNDSSTDTNDVLPESWIKI